MWPSPELADKMFYAAGIVSAIAVPLGLYTGYVKEQYSKIENKKSQQEIAATKSELSQTQSDLSQTRNELDEANKRTAALEERTAPRQLTDNQIQQLSIFLSSAQSTKFDALYVEPTESKNYAATWTAVLEGAGWEFGGHALVTRFPIVYGARLEVKDANMPQALLLKQALESINVTTSIDADASKIDNYIGLVIGYKE